MEKTYSAHVTQLLPELARHPDASTRGGCLGRQDTGASQPLTDLFDGMTFRWTAVEVHRSARPAQQHGGHVPDTRAYLRTPVITEVNVLSTGLDLYPPVGSTDMIRDASKR